MASNELEVLDPTASVEKIKSNAADRALNRRNLMAGLGIAGAAALGAGWVTRRSAGRPSVVEAASFNTTFSQTDYLNYLLNIKYLQATFYSYVTQGADLPANYTVNGTVYRPTFGTALINHTLAAKIAFSGANAAQITDMLNEIYYDELNQLINLQNLIGPLGTVSITRPLIDILGTGTNIAISPAAPVAGTLTSSTALAIARLLEDLSVSAFAGVAGFLSGTNLTTAAQIFAADGFHAGAIRLAIILQNTATPGTVVDLLAQSDVASLTPGNFLNVQPDDVAPVDPGVAATAAAGPIPSLGPTSALPVAQGFTASTTSGSNVLTSVSSIAGLARGYPIAGSGIPAGTIIVAISGTTVVISANASATATGVAITYTQPILASVTITGTTTTGSATITAASSIAGLAVGYPIAGPGIPPGTTIVTPAPTGTTITMSANATATATAVSITSNTSLQLTNCTAPVPPYTVNGSGPLYPACTAAQYQGFFATTGSGTASSSSPPSAGFVLKRSPSQVLSILLAAAPGAAPAAPALPSTQVPPISTIVTTGGFFPQGVNGQINVASGV